MASYQATVKSAHPAGETFGYLATFSNAVSWDPGVLAGEQLDPGPVGAGTRFRLVVPFLAVRMALTYEVVRHVPDREVVLAAASGLLRSTDRIVVTDGTDGTDGSTVSTSVSYGLADLQDLDAVHAFAGEFRASHDRLDVLIHNAGVIHPEFATDGAGTELTVLGQVVAPFLLTRLLMPALLAAAPSRVITVSSGGMYTQRPDLATLQLPASRYHGVTAYARAKRAQVALSREWAWRLAGTGVAFHAMHPGWVDTPGVAAALPRFRRVTRPILLSPEQGADTIVWLATAPHARLGSGRFWHDRRARPEYPLPWTRGKDPAAAQKLWDRMAVLTDAVQR